MENLLWTRLPLILMFTGGYLVYRLTVKTGLTEAFVHRALARSRGNIRLIFLYIILSAALLSAFVPNTITALAMLPVLKKLRDNMKIMEGTDLTTPLALSLIYGANIGGMGSLIGSPANLLLIAELDLYQVPGRYQITFLNWFLWAAPLVAGLAIIAWTITVLVAFPKSARKKISPASLPECPPLNKEQKTGLILFAAFLLFWTGDAVAVAFVPGFPMFEPAAALCFTAGFCYALFIRPTGKGADPLLCFHDLTDGVPRRGLVFLAILVLFIAAGRIFHADRKISALFSGMIQDNISGITLTFVFTGTVILLTEFFSNTLVSTAFFPIACFTATAHGLSPLMLMIAVSAASTCAFMTPVATPCNALVFGEMRGISIVRMLVPGAVMNIISACFISVWLYRVIPLVYG